MQLSEAAHRSVTSYVAGFCFENRTGQVVLIRKNKPDWQAGKLNGVGGKIEPGETPMQAMIREWREETGEDRDQWEVFLEIYFEKSRSAVYFFRANCDLSMANTRTDEKIFRASIDGVLHHKTFYGHELLTNLPWLVALALSGEAGYMEQ